MPNYLRKKIIVLTAIAASLAWAAATAEAGARYVFLFIGDGMGAIQRNAAELYLAGMREAAGDYEPRESQLAMNALPFSGFISTGSLSGVTDSAAAGTALATGRKTLNGAVAMNPKNGETFKSIAASAHDMGMKVGIVSSSFLQDATPAAFYGHTPRRTDHYRLGLQMMDSGFEYFAGGGFINPAGRDKKSRDLYDIAPEKGYRVVKGAGAQNTGRVIATHPKLSGGYMPYAIDSLDGPSLADFTRLGIRLLDGGHGFFMMVEGGRIDLACHANDAAAAIGEVIELDEAVSIAIDFYRARPDSTLIVVTSDHETGGMTLGQSGQAPLDFYRAISAQKGSYAAFERGISPKRGSAIEPYMEKARNFFGPLAVTPEIQKAFRLSMTARKNRPTSGAEYKKLYGPYDPFTMACLRQACLRAGVSWTTFYHTGRDVPVSAIGTGGELFEGSYDNTEIYKKILTAMGP